MAVNYARQKKDKYICFHKYMESKNSNFPKQNTWNRLVVIRGVCAGGRERWEVVGNMSEGGQKYFQL